MCPLSPASGCLCLKCFYIPLCLASSYILQEVGAQYHLLWEALPGHWFLSCSPTVESCGSYLCESLFKVGLLH